MSRWIGGSRRTGCCLLVSGFLLFMTGCGTRELGPANPDDTPKVNEAEIQENIERSMPEQYRQQYKRQS
jgi:apolipoprotein N-acyltransferase